MTTQITQLLLSLQNVYFRVDSAYKMDDHKFILVPEISTNENITLSKCIYE